MKESVNPQELKINERLRAFRELLGLSRPAFAERIGIPRSRLASFEENRAPLRWGVFRAAALAFGLSARWLATGEGHPLAPMRAGWHKRDIPLRALFLTAFAINRPFLLPDKAEAQHLDAQAFVRALSAVNSCMDLLALVDTATRERLLADPTVAAYLAALSTKVAVAENQGRGKEVNAPGEVGDFAGDEMHHRPDEESEPASENERKGLTSPLIGDYIHPMPTDIPNWKTLAERLGALLSKMGSRQKLMSDFSVTKQTVSAWLNGKRKPDAETTILLLRWVEKGGTK